MDKDYQSVLDYTKGLIAIRRGNTAFRIADSKKIKENTVLLSDDQNKSLVFAYRIENDDGDWIIAANASRKKTVIKSDIALKGAEVLADGEKAGTTPISSPSGVKVGGKKITLEPLTAAIIHIK